MHGPRVGSMDPVAAEGREVHPVVEQLAVHEARAPGRRPERKGEPRVCQRPLVAESGWRPRAARRSAPPAGRQTAARSGRRRAACEPLRAWHPGAASGAGPGRFRRSLGDGPRADAAAADVEDGPTGTQCGRRQQHGRGADHANQRETGARGVSGARMREALFTGHHGIVPQPTAARPAGSDIRRSPGVCDRGLARWCHPVPQPAIRDPASGPTVRYSRRLSRRALRTLGRRSGRRTIVPPRAPPVGPGRWLGRWPDRWQLRPRPDWWRGAWAVSFGGRAPVAQWTRASVFGTECRGFESLRARQNNTLARCRQHDQRSPVLSMTSA